ncbi:MAG: PorV/PorQ family protein [Flavobacteriales bacterium]|nr:PorV/PorQ family protein [Flavobacteriales bacterium]MDG1781652.1 PorV/PorQ family protein [Flavobacteriales bacterium]MDG2246794.1 PorV/PorQ family protein [Flavobacteriales bacterium]
MSYSKFLFTLITLLFCGTVFAQNSAPKYSNEFLSIGVGARALGMSNAQGAVVNDVTSGYWNPAGLLGIKSDLQIAGMHANYFANIAQYDYAAIGKGIDSVSAGSFSVIRFGVDNIPNTTELIDADGNINYDRITSFSAADYAFIFSYARKLKTPGLNVGASAKIIYRQIGDFATSWGFGIDAGATYERGQWRFGLMARDVTSTFNAWNITLDEQTQQTFLLTGNELPENDLELTLPRLVLSAARSFEIGEKLDLITAIDFNVTTDGKRNTVIASDPISVDPTFGLELGYEGTLFVRGGIGNLQYITEIDGARKLTYQPNIGIGLRIKRIYLDYALTDIGDQSTALYSNIFSLKLNIYKQN